MKSELQLFIIWSNAYYKRDEIICDIEKRFKILGIHKVSWNKTDFSKNLTRFYGENLPRNSNKEKLCGNDPFTLIVVEDNNPLYKTRMTSKGPKVVNVNMFDSKEMYRNWTGGGHLIHGTNSDEEFKHDIILLTGYSKFDYLKRYEANNSEIIYEDYTEMPGENGWKDINQVLYVLNETVNYVVLRNFDGMFSDFSKRIHGDIDILTDNRYLTKLALNAKPVHSSKHRVQHIIKIGDGGTFLDIRYVGDNYYCKEWEENIIKNRIKDGRGFYRPDEDNFIYALLYHALVQKKKISEDYVDAFKQYFNNLENKNDLKVILLEYLREHNYKMFEPNDYTVYFNEEITRKKMSTKKFLLKAIHKIFK